MKKHVHVYTQKCNPQIQ